MKVIIADAYMAFSNTGQGVRHYAKERYIFLKLQIFLFTRCIDMYKERNSLSHLCMFVGGVCLYMCGRHSKASLSDYTPSSGHL